MKPVITDDLNNRLIRVTWNSVRPDAMQAVERFHHRLWSDTGKAAGIDHTDANITRGSVATFVATTIIVNEAIATDKAGRWNGLVQYVTQAAESELTHPAT